LGQVAVLRQEGSNGDREMAAAFHAAGLEAWDVTVSDLLEGRAVLADFRGVVFVGGFSYADVLDSGKGCERERMCFFGTCGSLIFLRAIKLLGLRRRGSLNFP
jgi:phosphoribosylformylglycinamidine (FGAM) synthase-like amidotransferase family enzyme